MFQVAGWTLSEYSSWLDAHPNESDVLALIKGTLDAYAQRNGSRDRMDDASVYDVMVELWVKATERLSS